VAGITFVDRHVPIDLRATGQTLYNSSTFGLGVIAGSLVFGYLFDHVGASHMYAIAGGICAVATALLAALVRE
jgi:PPP family 3-phenylpropionic acid transporter